MTPAIHPPGRRGAWSPTTELRFRAARQWDSADGGNFHGSLSRSLRDGRCCPMRRALAGRRFQQHRGPTLRRPASARTAPSTIRLDRGRPSTDRSFRPGPRDTRAVRGCAFPCTRRPRRHSPWRNACRHAKPQPASRRPAQSVPQRLLASEPNGSPCARRTSPFRKIGFERFGYEVPFRPVVVRRAPRCNPYRLRQSPGAQTKSDHACITGRRLSSRSSRA